MEIITILTTIIILTILSVVSVIKNDKSKKIKLLKLKSFFIIEKGPIKKYNIIYKNIIKAFDKRRKNGKGF